MFGVSRDGSLRVKALICGGIVVSGPRLKQKYLIPMPMLPSRLPSTR